MNIDSITNGVVIDHITAGKAMKLYALLKLDAVDAQVAIIKNAVSPKMGRKDIIKIDTAIDLNLDLIGFIDPEATVNIIRDGKRVGKHKVDMPEYLTNVITCSNPRCITCCEQEINHVFRLTDREHKIYRCIYCEAKANI